MLIERLRSEAQSALDDLWTRKLIPFKLTVCKIDYLGFDEYILRFYDSRLRSVDVTWKTGDSFAERLRLVVLARMSRVEIQLAGMSSWEAA
ncbi:MAG TPA: hypothetical protein VNO50_17960 [Pyrinomonadaceae bacterium]|nr:hypothetical protein [Pyrinomonadaceae bacterium]